MEGAHSRALQQMNGRMHREHNIGRLMQTIVALQTSQHQKFYEHSLVMEIVGREEPVGFRRRREPGPKISILRIDKLRIRYHANNFAIFTLYSDELAKGVICRARRLLNLQCIEYSRRIL